MAEYMSLGEFEKEYRKFNKGVDLNGACEELTERVANVVSTLSKNRLFRPRIVEFRVKGLKNLYDKIIENNLDHREFFAVASKIFSKSETYIDIDNGEFSPYKSVLGDIIGGRVVCHNIQDIKPIVAALDHSKDVRIFTKSTFNEAIELGNLENGYRGLHCLAEWHLKKIRFIGEIQIRTILQDAWASFMHDDMYEHGAINPDFTNLLPALKQASDMFYSFDCMADQLRNAVQESDKPGISLERTLSNGLAGRAAFANEIVSQNYQSVSRHDTYEAIGKDGSWIWRFSGELIDDESHSFVIHMSGDTPAHENAKIKRIIDRSENEELAVDSKDIQIDKGPSERVKDQHLMIVRHNQPKTTHDYEIHCLWKDEFKRRREYIHVPWKSYYRISGDYNLELILDKPCVFGPKFLSLKEAALVLDQLQMEKEETLNDFGDSGTTESFDGKTKYSWKFVDFFEDAMVIWVFE